MWVHPPRAAEWHPQNPAQRLPRSRPPVLQDGPLDAVAWQGYTVVIEYGPGEIRHAGSPWARVVPRSWRGYGEIQDVVAEDGDDLDVVLGTGDLNGPSWVFRQLNPYRARAPHRVTWLSQPKLFLGFSNLSEVETAFTAMWPGHRSTSEPIAFVDGEHAAMWVRMFHTRFARNDSVSDPSKSAEHDGLD